MTASSDNISDSLSQDAGPATIPLTSASPEPIGKRLVLEEQRRAFDAVSEAARSIDQKLQTLLQSVSLIVSLVGIIQLATLRQAGGPLFWVMLIATALLYLILVAIILWGLRPARYVEPISYDWEELGQRYFGESEDHVLEQQISNYIIFTDRNRNFNEDKRKALTISFLLFAVIVIILLISIVTSLGT